MGDCCIPIILVCGSRSFIRRKSVRDSEDNLAPFLKETFYCHNCRRYGRVVIFKRTDWFTLCFIPIFPCHFGRRYLGCDGCRRAVDFEDLGRVCGRCGVIGSGQGQFCPSCGFDLGRVC